MSRALTFVVPDLPNSDLNPNVKMHWAAKSRLVKEEREMWYMGIWAVGQEQGVKWDKDKPVLHCKILFELTYPDRRQRDKDNIMASLKSCIDTLCAPKHNKDGTPRLSIIKDDSPDCLTEVPTLELLYEQGVKRTKITIEEVE